MHLILNRLGGWKSNIGNGIACFGTFCDIEHVLFVDNRAVNADYINLRLGKKM